METEKTYKVLTFLEVAKSWGFWILIFLGVLLTFVGYVLSFVKSWEEWVWGVAVGIIFAIVYALIRTNVQTDEAIPFAKNWFTKDN